MPPTDADRKMYLERALKAADWFASAQIKCPRPWMADANRFLYYYFMPDGREVPGLNWTHGRALFVLSEAYNITGDRRYLDSMELGARYLRALQPLDPYYQISHGAIAEEIPQAPWAGILDGAQAASGFLMLHQVTGNGDYLRRGRAFCELVRRTWRKDLGMPKKVQLHPSERVEYLGDDPYTCIHQASAIPLWHLYNITGEGQYLPVIIDAADRVLACQRADGGINCVADTSKVANPPLNHHWGLGEGKDRFLLRNDDGIVVTVLAAYKITGERQYLDAMVRYAQWTMANEPHERPYNAFGIQAANVLDIGKVSGNDWTGWVLEHLQKRCLDLQVIGSGVAKAEGGFRGEDEEGNTGIFGGVALDYVVTRVTCYMAGVLLRLSGKGTGSGFSVFGLDKGLGVLR